MVDNKTYMISGEELEINEQGFLTPTKKQKIKNLKVQRDKINYLIKELEKGE